MQRSWLVVLTMMGCGGSTVTTRAPCPDPLAEVPGFPNAQPVPGRAMATSMNPGMNSARTVYELATPSAEVVALYDRCLGPATTTSDGRVYALPSAKGRRSIAIAGPGAVTHVTVACERCY